MQKVSFVMKKWPTWSNVKGLTFCQFVSCWIRYIWFDFQTLRMILIQENNQLHLFYPEDSNAFRIVHVVKSRNNHLIVYLFTDGYVSTLHKSEQLLIGGSLTKHNYLSGSPTVNFVQKMSSVRMARVVVSVRYFALASPCSSHQGNWDFSDRSRGRQHFARLSLFTDLPVPHWDKILRKTWQRTWSSRPVANVEEAVQWPIAYLFIRVKKNGGWQT